MWWALSAAGAIVILLGGLALRDRAVIKKLSGKLGEKEEEVEQLQTEVAWYKRALARQSAADPDLDELDIVSAAQADAARARD